MKNEHVDNQSDGETQALDKDAQELQKALSELVRVYQFRDRKNIFYYDVSVTQCYALGALVARGQMSLNKLAASLYLDKSTASRVVDSLERKEYVWRTVDENDGRARVLKVTEKGLALHVQIEQDLLTEMKDMIADLDPDVRQATTRLISRFAKSASQRFTKLRKS